jgi:hypothetical protein
VTNTLVLSTNTSLALFDFMLAIVVFKDSSLAPPVLPVKDEKTEVKKKKVNNKMNIVQTSNLNVNFLTFVFLTVLVFLSTLFEVCSFFIKLILSEF